MKVKKSTKPSFPRSFGAFSPTGHVVTAFTTDADAEKARQTLLRNGFGEEEVTHYNKDEVLWEFMRNENHAISPVHIVMPFGLKFAEKYIRWTLEELT